MMTRPVPGVSSDDLSREAGVTEAINLGIDGPNRLLAVDYALWRWQKGEEESAIKTFLIDAEVDLTMAYRIIAVARAAKEKP